MSRETTMTWGFAAKELTIPAGADVADVANAIDAYVADFRRFVTQTVRKSLQEGQQQAQAAGPGTHLRYDGFLEDWFEWPRSMILDMLEERSA